MAGLTKERDTPTQYHEFPFSYLQATNTKIFNGSLVSISATGFAIPAADTANTKVVGRANATRDTTAAGPDGLLGDGVASTLGQGTGIEVLQGIFQFDNPANGGQQLTQADVGKQAFVLSDHEVTRTGGTGNAIVAGIVLAVDVANAKATIDTGRRA